MLTGLLLLRLVSEACQTSMSARVSIEYHWLALPNEAREQLLLHQFLAGLPSAISKKLRSVGDTRALDTTVERVRLLMTIERDLEQTGVAPISREGGGSKLPKVTELKTQLVELSK